MDESLSFALSDSISEETQSVAAELMEAGLDSVMDDGLLKEVPILSVAVSLYKIGHSVKERHYIRKLATFVDTINKGIADDERRNYYKNKVKDNPKQRDKELEYILILIDRYIHYDKSEKLAKLYLAYLDQTINWTRFTEYAEILDRFLPADIVALKQFGIDAIDLSPDRRLRLSAIGLIEAEENMPQFNIDENTGHLMVTEENTRYSLTDFADIFLKILFA